MKHKSVAHAKAVVLFLAVALASPLHAQQIRYRLIDLGTFGGPESKVNSGDDGSFSVSVLNNRGLFAGWAETPQADPFPAFCFSDDCYVAHAFQWQSGIRNDLGALADGVSSQAIWVSNSGWVAGISENGAVDPLVPDFPQLRAVLWKNGHIIDLGTLPQGGYESLAHAVNSKGQVVGDALNTIDDPNSIEAPGLFQTQTRAFLWENGAMRDLGSLGGTDAVAQFINEQGQVVGWSYTGSDPNTSCPGLFPLATDSFIWDRAQGMRDLGTLGGTCTLVTGLNNSGTAIGIYVNDEQFQRGFLWQHGKIQDITSLGGDFLSPEGINDPGFVAGWSYLAGNAAYHAALWRGANSVTDLGVVAGDDCSFASAIDAANRIVGSSFGDGCTFDENAHAFLWESGVLYDLNTLIPPGASLRLLFALGINDRGEIAGTGLAVDGNRHDFLLVPCAANSATDCQETFADASATSLSTRPALISQGAPFRRVFSRGLAHEGNSPRLLIRKK